MEHRIKNIEHNKNSKCIETIFMMEKCVLNGQKKTLNTEDRNTKRRLILDNYNNCVNTYFPDCLKNCNALPTNLI